MKIDVDGFELDTSDFSKKILFRYNEEKKAEVTFTLDFPPYTEKRTFENQKAAEKFIKKIIKKGDKVRYE